MYCMNKKSISVYLLLFAALLVLSGCGRLCKHKNIEVVNKTEATCKSQGYTGDTMCTKCGELLEKGIAVEMLEHQLVISGAVEPTCTTDGNSGVGVCSECKVEIHGESVISATGHDESLVNIIEATCKEKGYSGDVVCLTCEEVLSEGSEIEIKEHEIVVEGYRPASCTEDGCSGDKICDLCKEVIEKSSVIPKAHTTVTENYVKESCVSAGYSGDVVCTVCGLQLSKGNELPKLEHNPETRNVKPVTCAEDGYSGDLYCSFCNMKMSSGYVIKSEGHKHLTMRDEIAATNNSEGYSGDTYCSDCNQLIEKGSAVPKIPIVSSYESISSVEQQIFKSMNSARASMGLSALSIDNSLHPATNIRANEYRYWNNEGNHTGDPHHRPNGQCYYTVFAQTGISGGNGISAYRSHGEILAGSSDAEGLFDAWMNSSGHRAAILNGNYTSVSISVIFVNDFYYACAIFHD